MSKPFGKILAALFVALQLPIACAQQQTAPAAQEPILSNKQVSEYVRKALNIPSDWKISVTDATSDIPEIRALKIEFTSNRGTQIQEAWITPQKRLILGRSFDMTVDPYQKNWEKVNLNNVPTTGGSQAKVTIVEYSDFQCPFCSRSHVTMKELVQQYNGQVRLLYKHLPLTIHNWAEDAAVATTCVYEQDNGAFWQLSDYLFANQKTITKETLTEKVLEVAKQANLNTEQLKQCIDKRQTISVVQANMAEATNLGFQSTPSFLINGRTVVGALQLQQYKAIIDEMMATAK